MCARTPAPPLQEVPPDSHFSIENLPWGVFSADSSPDTLRVGTRLGDTAIDVSPLDRAGLLDGTGAEGRGVFDQGSIEPFMRQGKATWSKVRTRLVELLSNDSATLARRIEEPAFYPASEVRMRLPCRIGGYTDFYSSLEHATNVGTMFRGKENALLPNWRHVPIAYDGRAGSIVVSGTPVRRPVGQSKGPQDERPGFGPSRELDFELELGFLIGTDTPHGEPLAVERATDIVFGAVLVNDWSARDIQRWEYQPLGPFLAKNFCTSISPWVVTMEALEPFRVPGCRQEPEPLPYLRSDRRSCFDIELEVFLTTAPGNTARLCASNSKYVYWDLAQQLAHHSSNGCPFHFGDLVATGTLSGPDRASSGSLLELAWGGKEPLTLAGGATRVFLEDGDELTITGRCTGRRYTVGFGSVSGTILPAR